MNIEQIEILLDKLRVFCKDEAGRYRKPINEIIRTIDLILSDTDNSIVREVVVDKIEDNSCILGCQIEGLIKQINNTDDLNSVADVINDLKVIAETRYELNSIKRSLISNINKANIVEKLNNKDN